MNLKKLAAKAYANRKILILAASLVAPGVVAKAAEKVAKIKNKEPRPR